MNTHLRRCFAFATVFAVLVSSPLVQGASVWFSTPSRHDSYNPDAAISASGGMSDEGMGIEVEVYDTSSVFSNSASGSTTSFSWSCNGISAPGDWVFEPTPFEVDVKATAPGSSSVVATNSVELLLNPTGGGS